MLLQFSVENYRSYKERAVLSMEASADKVLPNNVTAFGADRLLKVATVFGANASGKSNLFIALTAAIVNIRRSNELQIGQSLFNITPFLFDEETKKKPSRFEFVFIQNGIKYVYGFAATAREVVNEYLYVYNSSKASTIFERDESKTDVYRFTSPSVRKELEPITKLNTKNKLFLSTATQWNSTYTREAFTFFADHINTYDSDFEAMIPTIGPILEHDSDHEVENFIIKLLQAADINIEYYNLELKDAPLADMINQFPPQLRGVLFSNAMPDSRNAEYCGSANYLQS